MSTHPQLSGESQDWLAVAALLLPPLLQLLLRLQLLMPVPLSLQLLHRAVDIVLSEARAVCVVATRRWLARITAAAVDPACCSAGVKVRAAPAADVAWLA